MVQSPSERQMLLIDEVVDEAEEVEDEGQKDITNGVELGNGKGVGG